MIINSIDRGVSSFDSLSSSNDIGAKIVSHEQFDGRTVTAGEGAPRWPSVPAYLGGLFVQAFMAAPKAAFQSVVSLLSTSAESVEEGSEHEVIKPQGNMITFHSDDNATDTDDDHDEPLHLSFAADTQMDASVVTEARSHQCVPTRSPIVNFHDIQENDAQDSEEEHSKESDADLHLNFVSDGAGMAEVHEIDNGWVVVKND